jgi:phage tail-like protein
MARVDPLRGFRFLVEIDGVVHGAFMRVKGLSREVKLETRREGGVNDYEHKLFSQASHGSLVLERGLALDYLWKWAEAVARGEVKRRKISIRLQDEAGSDRWSWHVDDAFPVKWSLSDMDAGNSQVSVESVEFAHHGLRKDPL